jgi:hypothetical protein
MVVVLGKRKEMSQPEILYRQPTGSRTRTNYRYRLNRDGSKGSLKRSRVGEEGWSNLGDRSVAIGGWSELVAAVESELKADPDIQSVTRTTP